eukprot:m.44058 g.44058  ORF g.44058 m.44058 type:complete len:379 (+) comp5811_c0_seq1:86-1222(+)
MAACRMFPSGPSDFRLRLPLSRSASGATLRMLCARTGRSSLARVCGARVQLVLMRSVEEAKPDGDRKAQRGSRAYRVYVSNIPTTGSWQDLKDLMRQAGSVMHAEVRAGGLGTVEFAEERDMQRAAKELDGARMRTASGATSRITVRLDDYAAADRSRHSPDRSRRSPDRSRRSRSPRRRTPPRSTRNRSPACRSPTRRSPARRSPHRPSRRSPARRPPPRRVRSRSPARARSRSPAAHRSESHSQAARHSHRDRSPRARSPARRDRSPDRSARDSKGRYERPARSERSEASRDDRPARDQHDTTRRDDHSPHVGITTAVDGDTEQSDGRGSGEDGRSAAEAMEVEHGALGLAEAGHAGDDVADDGVSVNGSIIDEQA